MKFKAIGYWLTTAVAALAFALPGVGHLVGAPQIVQDMARLGYPAYFLTVLGTWKILGAVAIVVPGFPRLKEWAYAGMIFDLTGAAASRVANQDSAGMVIVPLVIAGIVITSWALRPEGRELKSLESGRPGSFARLVRAPMAVWAFAFGDHG